MPAGDFLVPAVSLRGDRVVVVRDNAYEAVEDERGEPFQLSEFIEVFLKGYPAVFVIDIDALEQGAAQFDALGDLAPGGPEVWWDAAARDHTDVINILTAGADRAVVSTRNLRSIKELEEAVELTENVMLGLVTRGPDVVATRRVAQAGGPGQVARSAAAAGVEAFLLIDTARPLGGPVDWGLAAQVGASARTLYIGGGVAAEQAKLMRPPPGARADGFVVDLISVLTPFL